MSFQKGDFVIVTIDTKEKFKGQVKDIEKNEYIIEICTNKRKSEANELDMVRAREEDLEKVDLFA